MRRFIIDESGTELLAADFLYDLQQPTKKLTIDHFRVLALQDISSHLTTNTFAKQFLLLSTEEIFTVLEMTNQKMRTQVQESSETKKQTLLATMTAALRKKLNPRFVEKLIL